MAGGGLVGEGGITWTPKVIHFLSTVYPPTCPPIVGLTRLALIAAGLIPNSGKAHGSPLAHLRRAPDSASRRHRMLSSITPVIVRVLSSAYFLSSPCNRTGKLKLKLTYCNAMALTPPVKVVNNYARVLYPLNTWESQ